MAKTRTKKRAGATNEHGGKPHEQGIVAHVAIYLDQGVAVDEAYRKVKSVRGKKGVTVNAVHVGLGEIDMLVDIASAWTAPMGGETRAIGDWISQVRKLKSGDRFLAKRTSTTVCMNMV